MTLGISHIGPWSSIPGTTVLKNVLQFLLDFMIFFIELLPAILCTDSQDGK